jgi:hypothetical protein
MPERAEAQWHAIEKPCAPSVDMSAIEWPQPVDDEDPDPLFDSYRDYLAQTTLISIQTATAEGRKSQSRSRKPNQAAGKKSGGPKDPPPLAQPEIVRDLHAALGRHGIHGHR